VQPYLLIFLSMRPYTGVCLYTHNLACKNTDTQICEPNPLSYTSDISYHLPCSNIVPIFVPHLSSFSITLQPSKNTKLSNPSVPHNVILLCCDWVQHHPKIDSLQLPASLLSLRSRCTLLHPTFHILTITSQEMKTVSPHSMPPLLWTMFVFTHHI